PQLQALLLLFLCYCFFFSSRRRHTRFSRDWSSDVCSSDLVFCPKSLPQRRPFRRGPPFPRARPGLRPPPRRRASHSPKTPSRGRSEERRVGKECRSGWSPCREKKK